MSSDQLYAVVEDDGRGLGGEVEVHSTIGAGTRVTMRLPIRPAAA
ncbi:MAG: hypothetical protein QOE17_427 [Gaiellales bacterium]|jgi:chemotaxis protein histidine kinase CheA|nr:hypothetical protein [Gaiellales bacterium]